MISFSAFVRPCKDVLNSPVNYFFWNEYLNSASRLERVGGCPHNLSSSWQRRVFFWEFATNKPGESSMSPTPSLQSVGLGDRVQHSSFCGFYMLVICWTDQPVNRLNRYRWTLIPVPALAGEVVPVNPHSGTGSSRWSGSPVPVLAGEVVQVSMCSWSD